MHLGFQTFSTLLLTFPSLRLICVGKDDIKKLQSGCKWFRPRRSIKVNPNAKIAYEHTTTICSAYGNVDVLCLAFISECHLSICLSILAI